MKTISSGSGRPYSDRRLTSPTVVRELLSTAGIRPQRSYGQNFLVDANVLRRITEAARVAHYDTIVEVGPGLGALTQALAEKAGRVYAIEADRRMIEILRGELDYTANLMVIEADAMSFDLESLWEEKPPEGVKMVSNLPYNVAATLLVDWLRDYEWLEEYTVMVQREVADRIAAGAGGKDYSAATVKIQYRAYVSRIANVSRNSFYPRPRVESSILRLSRKRAGEGASEPRARDEVFFDNLVTAAFRQRRKKMANSVGGTMPALAVGRVADALEELGLSSSSRAEELTPAQFAALSNVLV